MDKWKDDIEKYISGKLTPAERHALEKQALNDPFLADALEGAESISPDNFTSDLNELNQKIDGVGKNRWMWPLRIAASIIGIALISTAIFLTINTDPEKVASEEKTPDFLKDKNKDTIGGRGLQIKPNQENQLALKGEDKKEKAESEAEETQVASLKKEEKKNSQELIALQSLKETKSESLAGGGGALSSKPSTASAAGPSELKADSGFSTGLAGISLTSAQIKTDTVAISFDAEETDDAIASVPVTQPALEKSESKIATRTKKLQTESTATSMTPKFENLIVNGQVRDQQGQPIPGVNIVVKGLSNGTVTNAEGKYSIALSDQNQTLVYSFIGYAPQEQTIDKAKTGYLDVQLQEDATQLSEVVVTGYADRNNNNSGEPVIRLAEPMGGRKTYDQYLEDKKVYPQQALNNKVEGRVIVEFTVTTTGALIDFNVVRKIGYGCEEEVIRLVKEGAKWYPTYIDNEAVESLVRVKTRFELKK